MATYYDPARWSLSSTPPGVRIPAPLVLAVAPALGALFLMFLPALGFWMVGRWLVVEAARGSARLLRRALAHLAPRSA